MLSGEIDFILKCVAPDLKTLQALVKPSSRAPQVRNVKTSSAYEFQGWLLSVLASATVGEWRGRALFRGVGVRIHEGRHHLARKQLRASATLRRASCRRTQATTKIVGSGPWISPSMKLQTVAGDPAMPLCSV